LGGYGQENSSPLALNGLYFSYVLNQAGEHKKAFSRQLSALASFS
jgi:hypothetical protein